MFLADPRRVFEDSQQAKFLTHHDVPVRNIFFGLPLIGRLVS